MATRTEEYWERRRLEEERQAARRRKGGTNADLPFGAARRIKATGQPCRVCALQRRRNVHAIEAHHIVHRSRIGSKHPLVHHPDNILPVCHTHHQDHHTTDRRIPWAALTPEERAFVVQQGGPAWAERWYPRGNDGYDNADAGAADAARA